MKPSLAISIAVSFFTGLLCVSADTHYVDLNGGNIAPYTSPATAAINPADAIGAATAGDVVQIASGVYTVPRPLQLDQLSLQGAANVVLNATMTNRVIAATNSTLSNLTIANGFLVDGVGAGASVTNCTVRNCVFRDNRMASTGAGGFGGNSRVKGIGLYAEDSDIIGSDFVENVQREQQGCHLPHVQGGGAHFVRCEVQDCRFLDNICDDGAGFWAADDTTVRNCLIQGNQKYLSHPVVLDSSMLEDSIVTRNTWGIWAKGESGIVQCEISDNVGDFGGFSFACVETTPGGGGIYFEDFSFAQRCRISGNSAGYGAGVMFGPNPGFFKSAMNNCLITGNILQDGPFASGRGAGVLFADSGGVRFCTISDNVSTGMGAIVEAEGLGLERFDFDDSIVWGNQGTTLGPGLPLSSFQLNILQGTNVNQNFNVDPLLTAEYRLSPGSPAINQADDFFPIGPTVFGDPRVIGSGPDIGADEYHPELKITSIDVVSDDLAEVAFNTFPNTTYQFEFTPDLTPPTWTNVGGPVPAGSGTSTTLTLPSPGLQRGVYRYRIEP